MNRILATVMLALALLLPPAPAAAENKPVVVSFMRWAFT